MSAGWVLTAGSLLAQLLAKDLISSDNEVNQIVVGIQNNTQNNFNVITSQREEAKIKQGKWTCLQGTQTSADPKTGFNADGPLSINAGTNWVVSGQRNHLNSTNAKIYINLAPDWAQEAITLYLGSNNGGTVWFYYLVSTGYGVNSNPQDSKTGGNLAHFTQFAASSNFFRVPAGQWGTGKNVFKFAWNATDGTTNPAKPAQIYVTITLEPA